jgi:hypothetical protein
VAHLHFTSVLFYFEIIIGFGPAEFPYVYTPGLIIIVGLTILFPVFSEPTDIPRPGIETFFGDLAFLVI